MKGERIMTDENTEVVETKKVDLETYAREINSMLEGVIDIQGSFNKSLKILITNKVNEDTFGTTDELVKQLLEYVMYIQAKDTEWKEDMDFVVHENFSAHKLYREITTNQLERDRSRIWALEKGRTITSAWLIACTVLFIVNIALTLGVFYVQP
jgi:hypothetical protein